MKPTKSVPISIAERADYVLSLKPESDTDSIAQLLRAIATRDVSWRVRAAAASHESLPTACVYKLAQDRNWRVRESAMTTLVRRGTDVQKLAAREPNAEVALAALTSNTANSLLEHDSAIVRAKAAYLGDSLKVRVLLADEKSAVRKAARENVIRGALRLGVREVRRFVSDNAVIMLGDACVSSITAYAEAVHALEDANEVQALKRLALRHIRFARAFDLSRFPEDRVLPWTDDEDEDKNEGMN